MKIKGITNSIYNIGYNDGFNIPVVVLPSWFGGERDKAFYGMIPLAGGLLLITIASVHYEVFVDYTTSIV